VRRTFSSVANPTSTGLALAETDGPLQIVVDTDQLATTLLGERTKAEIVKVDSDRTPFLLDSL
jgi:hypothetical protein